VPAWLPMRSGWGYLTGVGQIACGLGVLFSICSRIAAISEAGMISLFTLLVWGPAIVAAPSVRLPWTAFLISWAIASAAWVVAEDIWNEKLYQAGRGTGPGLEPFAGALMTPPHQDRNAASPRP
jgi:hypothetical protein